MKSTKLLAVIVVLQGLILLSQWTGSGPVTPAWAQIPDSGSQRNELINELKSLNGKVDKLVEVLSSGKLQVQVAKPDEKQQ
jgi:hypothetical protein